jgi:hypothetical protein
LVLLDWDPLIQSQETSNIFKFLQDHEYDPNLKEVHIKGRNITINLQSIIDNYNYTGLKDITKVIPSGVAVWLFLEHPELSEELRDAIATIPEIMSRFERQNEQVNNVQGIRNDHLQDQSA